MIEFRWSVDDPEKLTIVAVDDGVEHPLADITLERLDSELDRIYQQVEAEVVR